MHLLQAGELIPIGVIEDYRADTEAGLRTYRARGPGFRQIQVAAARSGRIRSSEAVPIDVGSGDSLVAKGSRAIRGVRSADRPVGL